MRTSAMRYLFLLFVAAGLTVGAAAQSTPSKQPNEKLIGVALSSNYARIADHLPSLRDSLVRSLPKHRKQVKVVGIDAAPQDAVEVAQQKGCDYLLQLDVSEMRGVGVGFSTFQAGREQGEISPQQKQEREELSWVVVNYRLRSLNNDDLNIADIDHVRYADLPIGWDPSSFETTIFRTVTRVAGWTLNQLPKK